MSQARVYKQTLPEFDFNQIRKRAEITAEVSTQLQEFIRRLHMDNRISTKERWEAIHMLSRIDLLIDDTLWRAEYVLSNCP